MSPKAQPGCFLIGATLLIASALPRETRAEQCPIPSGAAPRLASMDARDRLAYLHQTLDRQESYAQVWTWGWTSIGTALALGSFILADRAPDHAERDDNIICGAFSFLLPLTIQVFRLRVLTDAPKLDALVTGSNGAEPCLVLARAEELIARDAADEDFNSGVLAHLAAIGVNGVLFAILASMGHWKNAVLDGAGGVVISEVQLWTMPTGASRVWDRYRKGIVEVERTKWSLGPLSLRVTF
jgi:hypothetical protein